MTYLPFALLLCCGFFVLTFLAEKKTWQNRERMKVFLFINLAAAAAGVLAVFVPHTLVQQALVNTRYDVDFLAWVSDMFGIWYQIALPVFLVLLFVTVFSCLTALADKKQKSGAAPVVRMITVCFSSVVMLILAPFYGFMTENETLPLYQYILWSGVGFSLLFRLAAAVEYAVRIRSFSVSSVKNR